ncbi:hypothetical protein EVAR_51323_1 [Eumeta japonica]|uniref:Uncharacterized protein n=1 Tax=Eumeta variegata TaxID=151549 RepID=A0A4C1XY09_EUMVA|nr:hypothetical protein EVAR_51323_1 [Eumeta japonica]
MDEINGDAIVELPGCAGSSPDSGKFAPREYLPQKPVGGHLSLEHSKPQKSHQCVASFMGRNRKEEMCQWKRVGTEGPTFVTDTTLWTASFTCLRGEAAAFIKFKNSPVAKIEPGHLQVLSQCS